jgi:hypothetical protein
MQAGEVPSPNRAWQHGLVSIVCAHSQADKHAFDAVLQAMVSSSSEFFGDFEHHQEVSCTLGELLTQAQRQLQLQQQRQQDASTQADTGASSGQGSKMHLYLAQQPVTGPGELE